jgi:hypothetical protein
MACNRDSLTSYARPDEHHARERRSEITMGQVEHEYMSF